MYGVDNMTIKIKEVIERECCMSKDLKEYKGFLTSGKHKVGNVLFCVHCGQLWEWVSSYSGEDKELNRVVL